MTSKWFDMEQSILQCWEITQDLKLFADEYEHCDKDVHDKAIALASVYEMRFNRLWKDYEQALKEKFND